MIPTVEAPTHFGHELRDPLMALEAMPLREVFYPLGFPLEFETNSEDLLHAARESWSRHTAPTSQPYPALKLRLGVTPGGPAACPPKPCVRAFGHLLSITADAENFAVCDLRQGEAFGWLTPACVDNRPFLRYHFLEAIALCLLSGSRVTPIHGACVSYNGRGVLLCGESGAGKSTLAYACARSGWTYTADDATYLLWHRQPPTVRGNAHQVRFRPAARTLFPELEQRGLTDRAEGKPSLEVPTADLPFVSIAPETTLAAIVFLRRHPHPHVDLRPLTRAAIQPYFESFLFPLDATRRLQAATLEGLLDLPACELHYRDLDTAIVQLEAWLETVPCTDKAK